MGADTRKLKAIIQIAALNPNKINTVGVTIQSAIALALLLSALNFGFPIAVKQGIASANPTSTNEIDNICSIDPASEYRSSYKKSIIIGPSPISNPQQKNTGTSTINRIL